MAKPEAPADIPLGLHTYEPPAKEGRYDREVDAMIASGNPNAAYTIIAPNTRTATRTDKATGAKTEVELDEVAAHIRYFQESARLADRTAKVVSTVDLGDGSTAIEFVLGNRVSRPRTKDDEAVPDKAAA